MFLESYDSSLVGDVLASMREEASQVVESASSTGKFMERGTAYMRYVGQGHEISVPFETSSIGRDELLKTFESTYTSLYGRVIPDAPIEVISWTLNVSVAQGTEFDASTSAPVAAELASSRFREPAEFLQSDGTVALLQREELERDQLVFGPALISERHTTTVVPVGFGLRRLRSDHLLMFKEVEIEQS